MVCPLFVDAKSQVISINIIDLVTQEYPSFSRGRVKKYCETF